MRASSTLDKIASVGQYRIVHHLNVEWLEWPTEATDHDEQFHGLFRPFRPFAFPPPNLGGGLVHIQPTFLPERSDFSFFISEYEDVRTRYAANGKVPCGKLPLLAAEVEVFERHLVRIGDYVGSRLDEIQAILKVWFAEVNRTSHTPKLSTAASDTWSVIIAEVKSNGDLQALAELLSATMLKYRYTSLVSVPSIEERVIQALQASVGWRDANSRLSGLVKDVVDESVIFLVAQVRGILWYMQTVWDVVRSAGIIEDRRLPRAYILSHALLDEDIPRWGPDVQNDMAPTDGRVRFKQHEPELVARFYELIKMDPNMRRAEIYNQVLVEYADRFGDAPCKRTLERYIKKASR